MIPVAQEYNSAPKSTRKGAIPGTTRLNGKRKATASPETGLEVANGFKRPAVMVRRGSTTPALLHPQSVPNVSSGSPQPTQEQTLQGLASMSRDGQGKLPIYSPHIPANEQKYNNLTESAQQAPAVASL